MAENINQDRWISLQEVCNYPGVKHHPIMRWMDQCGMSASKVGKLWRFKIAGIYKWVIKSRASDRAEGIK